MSSVPCVLGVFYCFFVSAPALLSGFISERLDSVGSGEREGYTTWRRRERNW